MLLIPDPVHRFTVRWRPIRSASRKASFRAVSREAIGCPAMEPELDPSKLRNIGRGVGDTSVIYF